MRDLMGKIPTKEPDVTEEIYLSELVRCGECERTVPVGIEDGSRSEKAESPGRFSSTDITAAHMVLIMRRGRKV